jgi:osmotically-inducible protein OsmY
MSEERISWRDLSKASNANLKIGLLAGIAIGSAVMYLFDPRQGNRRRAVARDRVSHILNRSSALAGKTFRHLRNKLEGALANAAGSIRPEGVISDRKLEERIRSTVGRTIPHPGSIDFAVHEGRVTVRGYLKPHQSGAVVQAVERVPGVRSVDNQIMEAASEHPVQ